MRFLFSLSLSVKILYFCIEQLHWERGVDTVADEEFCGMNECLLGGRELNRPTNLVHDEWADGIGVERGVCIAAAGKLIGCGWQ